MSPMPNVVGEKAAKSQKVGVRRDGEDEEGEGEKAVGGERQDDCQMQKQQIQFLAPSP